MNLLFDPWIPVRCRSGAIRDIAPLDLADTDDPPLELAAPRPDFNGALAQFLIGVLQTTVEVADTDSWTELYQTPLSAEELRDIFAPDRAAFELVNESGPAFMQEPDVQALSAAEPKPLDTLLIDAPGANTIENNADLFIKRDRIAVLSPAAAAMALLSMQINAPSGGAGHRTSLRGGGPLTTLLWPQVCADGTPSTLWQKIWANVLLQRGDEKAKKRADMWPWLAATRTSEKGQVIQGGPLGLNYFACPRRIRLRWSDGSGQRCAVFGSEHPQVAIAWSTQNYGANYGSDQFKHPLSPYYRLKPDSEWLPLHPKPGGFSYRDFLSIAASDKSKEPARVVRELMLKSTAQFDQAGKNAIWAFGFDMDNMKARAWYEAYFPVYAGVDTGRLAERAGEFIAAAVLAREKLGRGLREAWSSAAEGNTQAVEQHFWAYTEAQFYQRMESTLVIDTANVAELAAYIEAKLSWIKYLRRTLSTLFEQYAEPNLPDIDALERAANARKKMLNDFYFSACKELQVPVLKNVDLRKAVHTPINTAKLEAA